MRISRALALALAVGCGPPGPEATGEAVDQLRTLIARYDSAWAAKDSATVANALAADYVYFTSTGGQSNRTQTLRFLTDTGYYLQDLLRTDLDISITDCVGRAASRWRGRGRYHGAPVNDDQTCVQHWRHVRGQWELFSEQCVNRQQADPAGGGAL